MRRGKKKRSNAWTKAQAQRLHAKTRLRQRYNIILNRQQYREAVAAIQRGAAALIERQSARVAVYAVHIDGQTVPVVYDRVRENIATALPAEVLARGGTRQTLGD